MPELATCQKHGNYELRFIEAPFFGLKPIPLACPKCSKEEFDAAQKVEAEAEYSRMLLKSQVPEEYHGCTLNSLVKLRPAARGSIDNAIWFFTNYEMLRITACQGSWLVIVGEVGNGKTGIACSIVQGLMRTPITRLGVYYTLSDLRRAVWDAKSSGSSESRMIDQLATLELLVIDEIGSTTNGEAEQALFFDIVNKRYANKRPMIIISNWGKVEMQNRLDERIFSRIDHRAGWIVCEWGSLRNKS